MKSTPTSPTSPSRREFLKASGTAVAGVALAGSLARTVHAAENNTIRVALVGCGGRGTGAAANALSTEGPTQLVAMADVFDFRVKGSQSRLAKQFGKKADVPEDKLFVGMDAYRKAIDVLGPGGLVILATPPAFRPAHVEYAVEKGCHVFMEKSFGVDFPGAKRVLAAGERANAKNLKIASGLMTRHYKPVAEAIRRIHDGEIGDIHSMWVYRMQGAWVPKQRQEGMSELAYQIQNFNGFPWLGGGMILDWLIHSLDVACWAKQAWPVSAHGQGSRQARTCPDQMLNHYAVEYAFADGTKMMAQCRLAPDCYNLRSVPIFGTKGSAVVGEKYLKTAVYSGYNQTRKEATWRYRGPNINSYQVEHDKLFHAIRNDQPYNETERSVKAAMTGILGRMAAYSGQLITWDEAMASTKEMVPGLDQMTMNSEAPVQPDADGQYPIPTPGITKVL